jgi:hypothetical protein
MTSDQVRSKALLDALQLESNDELQVSTIFNTQILILPLDSLIHLANFIFFAANDVSFPSTLPNFRTSSAH